MKNLKFFVVFLITSLCIQIQLFAHSEMLPSSIKVGVYENPPKIFINHKGLPDGIFIDIIKAIAKKENLEIEYVNGNWNGLINKLQKGEIDVLPDMAYTKKRDSLFVFNKIPVFSSWLEIFSRKQIVINSFSDLKGKKIGLLEGSVEEQYFQTYAKKKYNIDYEIHVYKNYDQLIKSVKNDEIDAVAADRFFYFSKFFSRDLISTGLIFHHNELHFGFSKKTNPALIKLFDKALSSLKNNPESEYYATIDRWLRPQPEIPEFLIWIAVIVLFVLLITSGFILLLRKRVKLRTKELRTKNNDLKIALEKAEEANQLKSMFLNNMSHEIRTPMNGILGFSTLLCNSSITSEERAHYSKIIQNNGEQLLRIIDDILEISSLETNQTAIIEEPFSLDDMLMEILSVFNLKSKERNIPIYLKRDLHNGQIYILSDKVKFNRIICNLLENALKFTNKGFIEIGYSLKEENLIVYVKDTGIGISRENKEIIFERFSQEEKELSRQYGGLGLGLSISRENANLLGGDITLESEKGQGSTFFVTVPYKPAKVDSNGLPVHSKEFNSSVSGNFTILIAEDEETNFLFIEALIEKKMDLQVDLIHANNGKEAVDICKENKNIDLILMDIKMPIMDGYEATKKIKTLCPQLPIIAQTAYSTKSDKELALKCGCDDFISKPMKIEELVELINKHLKTG